MCFSLNKHVLVYLLILSSDHLSIHQSIHPSTLHPFTYPSIYPIICQSTMSTIYPSNPSTHQFTPGYSVHLMYSCYILIFFSSFYFSWNDFYPKCNTESVVLEPLVKDIDVTFLKESLAEFISYTGSKVATKILENWETESQRFVKVNDTFRLCLEFLLDVCSVVKISVLAMCHAK